MKKILFSVVLFLTGVCAVAQIPPGYYDPAYYLSGDSLRLALHNIIKNHTTISYTQLWNAFQSTDKKPNDKVWDIYSDIPGGTPPYEFTFNSDQCGSYSSEGDCYNREHSFPQQWFDDSSPVYTDLFQLYPTDGYVNNKRGNLPYGDVGSANWTSQNGSKTGNCSNSGYSDKVFEPIDAFKGDLARSYLYIAVRYYGEAGNWPGSDMTIGAEPKPWAITMLLNWHANDTVSQKEIDRNNAIYNIQHNRNPFIDHPEWVWNIWGPNVGMQEYPDIFEVSVYPNPATEYVNVISEGGQLVDRIEIYSLTSALVESVHNLSDKNSIDVSGFPEGFYTLVVYSGNVVSRKKVAVIH
ncbi:MAG TPA: endonuclease [Bacteroidales bacterium]|nr:endonuclease [Bacteroidales bacterium]